MVKKRATITESKYLIHFLLIQSRINDACHTFSRFSRFPGKEWYNFLYYMNGKFISRTTKKLIFYFDWFWFYIQRKKLKVPRYIFFRGTWYNVIVSNIMNVLFNLHFTFMFLSIINHTRSYKIIAINCSVIGNFC